ncbi:uncharacterized protein LOC111707305 isoform X2 [Eurytemora carolleeae]|uniref:uncharacterized protein LOC111707305 isoform X2 n=1 Tax=Eurytemora carolleeae TaxID=1294199 RepID=UPI000C7678F4|nr:uncharacterized protein LOC111707305 isoform X2 [Eurytemora carolleeae]|eukprot:XP_023336156.1 uncharacterized protein LOC111707305 isoform X2 [Eurytemora affinis]
MGLSQPVKELFLVLNSSSPRQDLGNISTVETIRSQQYQTTGSDLGILGSDITELVVSCVGKTIALLYCVGIVLLILYYCYSIPAEERQSILRTRRRRRGTRLRLKDLPPSYESIHFSELPPHYEAGCRRVGLISRGS